MNAAMTTIASTVYRGIKRRRIRAAPTDFPVVQGRLGIEQARRRNISDILITCDDDNIGSCRIIEANGGILQDKIDNGRGVLTRRYWIYADS